VRNALRVIAALLIVCAAPMRAAAQDHPRGEIVDEVWCAADPTQGDALYVPSSYVPGRNWSLLMGFHPADCGDTVVVRDGCRVAEWYLLLFHSSKQNKPPARMASQRRHRAYGPA
jgi:hypothetical protein